MLTIDRPKPGSKRKSLPGFGVESLEKLARRSVSDSEAGQIPAHVDVVKPPQENSVIASYLNLSSSVSPTLDSGGDSLFSEAAPLGVEGRREQ